MSASGPHILVTGSTWGIGADVTQVLASWGVRVVGHGRTAGDAFLALDAPASMMSAVLDINGASYVR